MDKKILIGIITIFILISLSSALEVVYNPFTSKLDYVVGVGNLNVTGYNVTADYFFGNGSYLNTNSSDYWDDMNTINATQMEDSSGTLNILESWLTSLYCLLTGCNMTGNLNTTGNVTASYFFGDGSELIGIVHDNSSWNESYADGLYADISVTGDNSSWNQTHANTLYIEQSEESNLNVNSSDYLDTYDSSYFMPLNTSVSGNFDFNGGWLSNGFSIIGGDIYAQTGYFYNISSLSVSQLDINGSLLPYEGFNNTFDIGNSTGRWWKDLYLAGKIYFTSGNMFANSTSLYYDNGTIVNDLVAVDQDVPYGAIQAFYLSSCPSGWVLADGTDNTPDLRGLFIRGSGTSGVLKDANDNYISATYGEYWNDSFQGHWHDIWRHSGGGGEGTLDWSASSSTEVTTGLLVKDPIDDGTHGTPRTSNETRPFSYNTIYCMKISNQKFLTGVVETYDTGWLHIYNNDWTNVHLGSDNSTADTNLTHNLDADLSELDVHVFISTDGTDANSFEVQGVAVSEEANPDRSMGFMTYEVDSNNLIIQTGTEGIWYLSTVGVGELVNIESWYYKIVVQKVPEYVGVEIGDYKINGDLNVTENLMVTGVIDGEIKNYDTGWVSNSDWTNQHLGTSAGGNVVHNLAEPLYNLLIIKLVSSDGTDNNAIEIGTSSSDSSDYGLSVHQVDTNNILIQTGTAGILYSADGTGTSTSVTGTQYYKIKVFKLG